METFAKLQRYKRLLTCFANLVCTAWAIRLCLSAVCLSVLSNSLSFLFFAFPRFLLLPLSPSNNYRQDHRNESDDDN